MKTLKIKKGIKLPVPSSREIRPLEIINLPSEILIPLKQHKGIECEPVVKKGKEVKRGEVIGRNSVCVVHSSVCGKVKEIRRNFSLIGGGKSRVVVVQTSEKKEEGIFLNESLGLLGRILEGGVVDFCGETPPLILKIEEAQRNRPGFFVINGLEEFFVFGSKASLLKERKEYIEIGIELLKRLFSFEEVILVVYKEVLKQIEELDFKSARIVPVVAKHPVHKESILVFSLFKFLGLNSFRNRDFFILDLETVYSVGKVVKEGVACLDKVITVTEFGSDNIRSVIVPLGTPISWVLKELGVESEDITKVVINGPISGVAVHDLDYPVTKEVNQIFVLKDKGVFNYTSRVCVKCGLCVEVCPANLIPFMIAGYSESKNFELAQKNNLFSCIECGSCGYVCPLRIPLLQWIKLGKHEIIKETQGD